MAVDHLARRLARGVASILSPECEWLDNLSVSRVLQGDVHCRVCTSPLVRNVLDLGVVPLANAFLEEKDVPLELSFPLGVRACATCGLAQLTHLVDPEILFRHYLYTPSASTTWVAHCEELSTWIRQRTRAETPFVVEPASNDGCLLRAIQGWAPRVLGVEPARNIAELAVAAGVPTLPEFFSAETAATIRRDHGAADVIVATNVLAHVPNMLDFLDGVRVLLGGTGIAVFEAPYLRDLVESMAYDTIYHEHVSYLSVTALERAFALAGLTLTHVERTPVHGGSLRFVGRVGGSADDTVARFIADERALGYADGHALEGFSDRVNDLRRRLKGLIDTLQADGARLAGYGATAKGNTLLTTAGIGRSDLRYIVDRNPLKRGLLAPGTHIPVVDQSRIESDPVDVLVLLAWNLAEEIMDQQRQFAARGGRFLIPIPEPRLV